MRSFILLLLLQGLVACVAEAPPVSPPASLPDGCGAAALQGLVGQPATVLQTMRFGQTVRVILPDMMVTQDYSAGRLNIYVDEAGVIGRVTCG